eukprot:contig_25356_g6252
MTGVLQQRCARGTAGEDMGVEFHFQSLATRIFSLYEILDDAARAVPIVERRKNSRCGRFNTTRLRALQQFILGVGGASLSVREQKQLYNFLEVRDRRDSVDPMSGTDGFFLSAVFPTVSSFVTALRDELHDAVLSEGWKKLKIREGGTVYEVYYRYLVKHDEPQAVFTGKQQQEEVSTMPYLVAGVWRASREPLVPEDVDPEVSPALGEGTPCAVGDGIDDAVPDLAARVAALCLGELGEDGGAECNADGEDAGDNSTFDWLAYRAVWKDTPMDEAITAMFAEFAVLHAEMSGNTCSTSPLPLTLDVGKCIADRAKRFVTLSLTPILGPDQSSEVHRLLCHVMDAIRVHGNINNGSASINERMHKEDKPYYARTNRSIADFTHQLIVQAQGARAIQRHIVNDDEDLATVLEHFLGDGDGDSDAGVTDAIGLPEDACVRISSRISFEAVFECGWTVKQLLYAFPCFRGEPW